MPQPATEPMPFQSLYVAHRAAVLRLLVGMVGVDDAQDCFQDTWLKVLRAWPPEHVGGRLDSWTLTIAHRVALDLLRRRGRELPVADLPERPVDPDQLVGSDPGELARLVAPLAPKQRAAVVLRVVLDLSHAQVAEVLDCSEDAARRSYADALAVLRRELEERRSR